MKKIIYFVLLLMILLMVLSNTFTQVNQKPDGQSNWETDGLKGKVKESIETAYDDIEYQSEKIEKNPHSIRIRRYDRKGNLLEFEKYIIGEKQEFLYYKGIFNYNNDNLLIEEIHNNYITDFSGEVNNPKVRTIYKYDDKNNLIEKISYNYKNEITERITFEYDSKNNLIEKISYNYKNEVTEKIAFEYDSKNNLIKEIKYDDENNIKFESNYKYDFKGNLIEHEGNRYEEYIYNSIYKYVYKYDENNNLIEEEFYEKSKFYSKIIYIYDNNGKKIEKQDISDNDKIKIIYKYDSKGNLTEELTYYGSNLLKGKIKYSSDEIGNMIKEEYYSIQKKDGEIVERLRYIVENQYTYWE